MGVVAISNVVGVSGTVSVANALGVSGTVTVSGVTTVSGTVTVSGVTTVSGSVSLVPNGSTFTPTVTGVVSGAATLLLALNAARKALLISNASGTTMYVGVTSGVTAANGVPVSPSLPPLFFGNNPPVNAFYAIATGSGATAVVWEGN